MGGEVPRRDGARVDLEAQREVGRGDAAAQELQQPVRGGGIHDGPRGAEGSGAAWPRRRLEPAETKAHGADADEASSRARGRRRRGGKPSRAAAVEEGSVRFAGLIRALAASVLARAL